MLLGLGALALLSATRVSQAQDPIEMGLDMEVTGNDPDTLGPTERSYGVFWSGTPFDGVTDWTIDVYVTGDTQAPLNYDAWVIYDATKVHVVSPTDPLIKMPNAQNFGDSPPDSDGQFNAAAIYLDPPYSGIAGNGTLVRIGIDIGDVGEATFGFAKGAYNSAAGSHGVTTFTGQLTIVRPVGGIAELPDVVSSGGSSGRYLVVLGVAVGAGAIVLGAGAVYAGRRQLR